MRDRAGRIRDSRAARPRIDVDPLVVAARLGELVDALLGDLEPVARRDLAADPVRELVE